MSLATEIRKIQYSESDTDKFREITTLFEQYKDNLGIDETWGDFFSLIQGAVCDNINSPANIVAFATSVPEYANLFASLFSLAIVEGGSGTFYLSWSKPLKDDVDCDVDSRIVDIIKSAFRNENVIESLQLLKKMLPKKEIQLFLGNNPQAIKSKSDKKVVWIVDSEIYLFCD